MLDPAGLGESPLVVRVDRRCRCFVGVCRLGYSEEVEDSCFARGCRKRSTVQSLTHIGCRAEVGLVVGIARSAGRSSRFAGFAAKEDRVGFAGYR